LQWNIVLSAMQVDPSSPTHTSFLSSLQHLHSSSLTLNRELSTSSCLEQARSILAKFEHEARRWTEQGFEHFRLTPAVRAHLAALRSTPFCKGPAFNAAEVDSLFRRSEATVLGELESRNNMGRALLLAVDVLAVWSIIGLWRLRATGSGWSADRLGTMDYIASRLALPAALLTALTLYLLPEADLHEGITYAVAALIILYAAVSMRVSWIGWRKHTDVREKCEV
jgi:hypothetical protein